MIIKDYLINTGYEVAGKTVEILKEEVVTPLARFMERYDFIQLISGAMVYGGLAYGIAELLGMRDLATPMSLWVATAGAIQVGLDPISLSSVV